jgi:hypothetical protein
MKIWSLIMGIIIVSIMCSSALAISKSDLISNYRTGPSSLYSTYNSDTSYQIIKEKSAQFTPAALPTAQPNVMPFPKWPDSTFLQPFSKPSTPPTSPHERRGFAEWQYCPPAVPTNPLYHIQAYCSCFKEDPNCGCIDPVTGEHYKMASDLFGNVYVVKPDCQCSWGTEW